jgi:DNA-binding MarR family transcriptional regulator
LLASKKLVRCRPDEADARATRVYLSEAARRFRPIAERAVADLEGLALKQAGPGETELVRSWLKRFAKL